MDEYKIVKEYEEAKKNNTLPEMPEPLDAKCRELIDEAFGCTKRRTWAKRVGTAIAKAAMVVLILLGLSTVMVLSVDAFRVPVLNFLMDAGGKYATVTSNDIFSTEDDSVDKIISRFNEFIPYGYDLVSCVSSNMKYAAAYQDSDQHVIFLARDAEECIPNVDAEGIEFVSLDFGEYPAVFSEEKGYRLIWLDTRSNAVYTLFATGLTADAFWEFAYSLIC